MSTSKTIEILLGWLIVATLSWGPALHAQVHPDDQTLSTMCRNGLAEAAVRYAQVQRDLLTNDSSLEAKWTMRLMECYAQLAVSRRGADAIEAWQQCEATLATWREAHPDQTRLPWLEWQLARCDLLRAQSRLAEYLAAPAQSSLRDETLELVRQIVRRVELLIDEVRQRMPLAARTSVLSREQASPEQLAKLEVDAGLLRCEALLIRARLYPAGSRDRIAAAADVVRQAAEIVKSTGPDWPSRDALEIAKAAAEFELGESQPAVKRLIQLAQQAGDDAWRVRAAMLAIEHLTSNGEISSARRALPIVTEAGFRAEAEIAKLQIALAELQGAEPAARERLLSQIIDQAKQIGADYGAYWRNRAEALLVGSVNSNAMAEDGRAAVDLLVAEVRQLLAADEKDAAAKKLRQATENAITAGNGSVALQVASLAAALLGKQQRWLEAADILESTSLAFSTMEPAAEAHLQAIYALSQALRADGGNQSIAKRYEAALVQQLETWPDSNLSNEPQAWLGRWLASQNRSDQFVSVLLTRIERCGTAEAASQLLLQWLAAVLGLDSSEQRGNLINAFSESLQAGNFAVMDSAAAMVHVAAIAFADWPGNAESEWISRRLRELESVESSTVAGQLRIAVQLAEAIRGQELARVRELADWSPEQLPTELRRRLAPAFVEAVGELPVNRHSQVAGWLLLDEAWSEDLLTAEPETRALGFRVRLWSGDDGQALEGLKALAGEHPRDGNVQLQLAHALADAGPQSVQASMSLARKLAASSKPGSEISLAARWRIVRNQLMAGELEQAKQDAAWMLAAQPDLSEVWKRRFEQVAKQ